MISLGVYKMVGGSGWICIGQGGIVGSLGILLAIMFSYIYLQIDVRVQIRASTFSGLSPPFQLIPKALGLFGNIDRLIYRSCIQRNILSGSGH